MGRLCLCCLCVFTIKQWLGGCPESEKATVCLDRAKQLDNGGAEMECMQHTVKIDVMPLHPLFTGAAAAAAGCVLASELANHEKLTHSPTPLNRRTTERADALGHASWLTAAIAAAAACTAAAAATGRQQESCCC